MLAPTFHHRLSDFTHLYDAFIVDLWGVIHDGGTAYPGVHDALKQLKADGKRILFLSNAPRRASKAIAGLERLGVLSEWYDHVVTSGEVAREQLIARYPQGASFFYIGPDRDANLLDGLPQFTIARDESTAAFGIITGFDKDDSTIEEKLPQLQLALKARIPLFCVNPDKVIVRITGTRPLCAGVIAEYYEQMGGVTEYYGKPHRQVYEKALQLLGPGRIAAIGDSMTTDILGANQMGIDSYLIAGGIQGKELGIQHGELPKPRVFEELCERYGIRPTGVLAGFVK